MRKIRLRQRDVAGQRRRVEKDDSVHRSPPPPGRRNLAPSLAPQQRPSIASTQGFMRNSPRNAKRRKRDRMNERMIVVGAGQAGLQIAESLRAEGFSGELVLLGDEKVAPYQRPPLSKAWLARRDRGRPPRPARSRGARRQKDRPAPRRRGRAGSTSPRAKSCAGRWLGTVLDRAGAGDGRPRAAAAICPAPICRASACCATLTTRGRFRAGSIRRKVS